VVSYPDSIFFEVREYNDEFIFHELVWDVLAYVI